MHGNLAKAVLSIGDATKMAEVGSGQKVLIGAEPWKGEPTPEQAVVMLLSRYGLSEQDGALGLTRESLWGSMLSRPDLQESRIFKDNVGRTITRIIPKKVQAWDFSKAPIGYAQAEEGTRQKLSE